MLLSLGCGDRPKQIMAQKGFKTYQWNNGIHGTNEIDITDAGSYSLTVTDSIGCIAGDSILIEKAPLPQVSLGNDTVITADGLATLIPKGNFTQYQWQDGTSAAEYLIAGRTKQPGKYTYRVEVTGEKGCINSDRWWRY
jgi:hypothetical protein